MSHYVRAPKAKLKGSIQEICDEDKEDFEQEMLIKQWLESQGLDGKLEFKHISRKGTARNTLDKRSIRLDKKVSDEEGSGTYADLIAGSDGRDLECGPRILEADQPTEQEKFDDYVNDICSAFNFNEETRRWLSKSLKLSKDLPKLRRLMKEEPHFEISMIDLESVKPFRNFKK